MEFADLVLMNGKILTFNSSQPRAQAVAVRNGRIIHVGLDNQIKQFIGNKTKVINLHGKTVVPGFIDTHAHLTEFGLSLLQIDLRNVSSIREIQQKLKQFVKQKPPKKWILGFGWDQERLKEKRYPTRWDLDKVAPNNPVILDRICKHICVVNTKALELAGLTKNSKVEGGQIDKEPETGELTGVLRENAKSLVWNIVPPLSDKELEDAMMLACQKAVEVGLTGVHWIVSSLKEYFLLKKLREEDALPLRVYAMIPIEHLDELVKEKLFTGFGDHKLKIGCVKILLDGSLGARTAALNKPYHDQPQNSGILLYSKRELEKLVMKAHRLGFQLAIHAIGDKAIETALDAVEKALKEEPKDNHRHRIEHASVLNRELIKRLKKLRIIASVQPHFIVSDFWVVERVGKFRARWVYPFKTLLNEGVCTSGSSDSPIEPLSPLLGIWAAVSRESFPEERISLEEALQLYTLNAAFASFEENVKGSIEMGKFADFVVLSHDLTEIELEKIRDVEVEMTIVDGKIVFSKL
jgi:predicted amidohydrolase YtcJ